jgi:hypothetical protein
MALTTVKVKIHPALFHSHVDTFPDLRSSVDPAPRISAASMNARGIKVIGCR